MNSQGCPTGVTPPSGRGSKEAVVQRARKRIALACVAASLVILSVAAIFWLGKADRIAVAATGQTSTATVDSQAARSPFFLLFDKKGAFVQAIENPYKDQAGGGISVVEFLSGKGVTALVAEAFGPRIVEVMQGKGIRPVEFKGIAADAVRSVLRTR
jgi:predicted Fe-Mo cluster-binding NifX family protein